MIVKNCTMDQLEAALNVINKQYDNNVEFLQLFTQGKRINFRLAVKDSSKDGARRGFHHNKDGSRRKLINACWHVHGHYFEALLDINSEAVIKSGNTITIDKNGGNWQDRNIGSQHSPLYFSEACECE